MIQASRLPIVLCCAEESEVALVAVVDALHRDGHAPEVVPGVETDTSLLTAATDRVRGPALFVLCQSDDLDRFQVRRLEGLFSARKGPAHRMITVEVAQRSTAAIVSEVRAAAREVSHGRGGRDDDDGSYMRDVVKPTSVAAVPGATIPDRGPAARGRAAGTPSKAPSITPAAAIVQAPEGISDEALGLESSEGHETDTEVVDPFELQRRRRVGPPEVQLSTDPAARAALESADWETDPHPSDGVPLAVPEDFPTLGESGDDIEVRGAPRGGSWADSGPVEVERVAKPAKADPRAESDHRPLATASTPIDIGRPAPPVAEPAPPERRGVRVLLLLVAIAGMAAVVTMAVLHATAPISGGPQDVHERGVPSGTATPGAEPTPPTEPPPSGGEPPPAGDEPSPKVEPTPVPTPEPAPAASTGDDTAGASGDDTGAGTGGAAGDASTGPAAATSGSDGADDAGDAAADGEAVVPDGDARTRLVPPPPTGAGAGASEGSLEAAIAEGRIRELGDLLVLGTGPSTVTWDAAASRCARRKVGGLGNWRLPSKGQLGELRRAKLLAPGSYWSRSTVGEDEAVVVDAGTGEAAQWLKMEPNGRVVCIRPRPA